MSKRFKAILDTAFDYQDALNRQNLRHEDVVKLRVKALRLPSVPKLMFDKQVSQPFSGSRLNRMKFSFSAYFIYKRQKRQRRWGCRVALKVLQHQTGESGIFRQSKPRCTEIFIHNSRDDSPSNIAMQSLCFSPSSSKSKSIALQFWWRNKNVHDDVRWVLLPFIKFNLSKNLFYRNLNFQSWPSEWSNFFIRLARDSIWTFVLPER